MAPSRQRRGASQDDDLVNLNEAVVVISSSSESEADSDESRLDAVPISLRQRLRRRSTSYTPSEDRKRRVQPSKLLSIDSEEGLEARAKRKNTRSTSPNNNNNKKQKIAQTKEESNLLTNTPETIEGMLQNALMSDLSRPSPKSTNKQTASPASNVKTISDEKKSRPSLGKTSESAENVQLAASRRQSKRIEDSEEELGDADDASPKPMQSSNISNIDPSKVSSSTPPLQSPSHVSTAPSQARLNSRTSTPSNISVASRHTSRETLRETRSSQPPPSTGATPAQSRNDDDLAEITYNDYEHQPSQVSVRQLPNHNLRESLPRRKIDAGSMATRTRGIAKKFLINEATGETIRVFVTYRTPNRLDIATLVKKYSDKDLLSKPRADSLNLTDPDYVEKLAILPILNDFV